MTILNSAIHGALKKKGMQAHTIRRQPYDAPTEHEAKCKEEVVGKGGLPDSWCPAAGKRELWMHVNLCHCGQRKKTEHRISHISQLKGQRGTRGAFAKVGQKAMECETGSTRWALVHATPARPESGGGRRTHPAAPCSGPRSPRSCCSSLQFPLSLLSHLSLQ